MADDLSDQFAGIAERGDSVAAMQLLVTYRVRLKRMVSIHLDRQLAARIDPSDVVQESLAEAVKRLPRYLQEQPVALYPWLRKLAWERLLQLRQHHFGSQKRTPAREVELELNDESTMQLAERLMAHGPSPSDNLIRRELRQRVHDALAQLSPADREILSMRYLEQLSVPEATSVLGISNDAFMKRHWRAMQRIRPLLDS